MLNSAKVSGISNAAMLVKIAVKPLFTWWMDNLCLKGAVAENTPGNRTHAHADAQIASLEVTSICM